MELTSSAFLISDQPLSVEAVQTLVESHACGAVNLFVGTVRNATKGESVVRLEFEAYESMAVKEMAKIGARVKAQWPAEAVVIHHRVGSLEPGEIAVIIGVSTPHRKASFEACEFAIDTLKETVPIWKKEILTNGEVWVSAHP
ncbi:molybdenum cofactor biosynthesis protein MoaE [Pontibacter sp. G13]|uniref:molybdenum cofactor biosynthesis protein MoaE n=1 Tax=Pontibacter sp. G13 TaxID=3074898 RepID=UPI002889DC36|nr:molybdenum cofactor biosynthesis protein MoaE [Pontibacter sp. G13]WNJ17247.1 molybdenum cofactor biosynthesis protein MoaE [Pontibacter sp. G13]